MLKVEVPKDKKKIKQQIAALKYQISIDTNETDRKIHGDALRVLEKTLSGSTIQ